MSDVTCACCAPVIAEVRARGLPPEPLVEGLGLDLSKLENPHQRIPWNDFAVFYRRATALLGPDALEDLALRSSAQSVPRVIRRLLPKLGDARVLYRMGARWWGPWVFRGTRASCEEIADGRLREVIEILPGYDECPEFFPGIRGVLRAMPLLFGQPEAVVELVKWDERQGEFLITPPPARRRLRRTRHRTEAIPEELEEMGFGQEQLRDSQRRTRAASALLAGRARQLGALTRIGRELARNQPGREQAQTVVRLLQEHFRVRAVRVSCEAPKDGGTRYVAESGEPLGAPSESRALRVAGRRIGRLEFWGLDAAAITRDDAELLRELLPWIALALERAWQQQASVPVVEELNDVLTVILGYATLVSDDLSEAAPARAELEQIRTASERAAALVSRLLEQRTGGDQPDQAPRTAPAARGG